MRGFLWWLCAVVLFPFILVADALSPKCPRCGSRAKAPIAGLRREVTDTDCCFSCYYTWDRLTERYWGDK